MTEREVLKLALEALEVNLGTWSAKKKAIPAIKEVLAQPEPGTPAVVRDDGNICYQYTTPLQPEPVIDKSAAIRIATSLGWEPKRTWVGLTEKDFSAINQSSLTKLQAATSAESILKKKNS